MRKLSELYDELFNNKMQASELSNTELVEIYGIESFEYGSTTPLMEKLEKEILKRMGD